MPTRHNLKMSQQIHSKKVWKYGIQKVQTCISAHDRDDRAGNSAIDVHKRRGDCRAESGVWQLMHNVL
jgi:hypothetical protein